jgi:outer membrane protein assembly factor BamB
VEVETGKMLWLYDWEVIYNKIGYQVTDPIIFDSKLFIAQYFPWYLGGFVLDISGKEPKVLWKNKDLYSQTSSPVMIDGYLYICQGGIHTGAGSLQCLDVVTGKIMWEERLDERPISLMAADGKLIILDYRGNLFLAEATPSIYKEISKCIIPDQKSLVRWSTYPVLCGGKIYCRSDIGDLVCIDVRK